MKAECLLDELSDAGSASVTIPGRQWRAFWMVEFCLKYHFTFASVVYISKPRYPYTTHIFFAFPAQDQIKHVTSFLIGCFLQEYLSSPTLSCSIRFISFPIFFHAVASISIEGHQRSRVWELTTLTFIALTCLPFPACLDQPLTLPSGARDASGLVGASKWSSRDESGAYGV
jgi:hypothetical protein